MPDPERRWRWRQLRLLPVCRCWWTCKWDPAALPVRWRRWVRPPWPRQRLQPSLLAGYLGGRRAGVICIRRHGRARRARPQDIQPCPICKLEAWQISCSRYCRAVQTDDGRYSGPIRLCYPPLAADTQLVPLEYSDSHAMAERHALSLRESAGSTETLIEARTLMRRATARNAQDRGQ